MRKILTILLTVLMVATLGTVNVFGDTMLNDGDTITVTDTPAEYNVQLTTNDTITLDVQNSSTSGLKLYKVDRSRATITNDFSDELSISASGTVTIRGLQRTKGGDDNKVTIKFSPDDGLSFLATINVVVVRSDIAIVEEPTATTEELVYDGEYHNLLSKVGSLSGKPNVAGDLPDIWYRVTAEGAEKSESGWTKNSNSISGKEPGVYTVDWIVPSNNYYNGSKSGIASDIEVDIPPYNTEKQKRDNIPYSFEVEIKEGAVWANDSSSGWEFDGVDHTVDLTLSKSSTYTEADDETVATSNVVNNTIKFEIDEDNIKFDEDDFTKKGVFSISGVDVDSKLIVTKEAKPGTYKIPMTASLSGEGAEYYDPSSSGFVMTVTIEKTDIRKAKVVFNGSLTGISMNEDLGTTEDYKYFFTGSEIDPATGIEVWIGDVKLTNSAINGDYYVPQHQNQTALNGSATTYYGLDIASVSGSDYLNTSFTSRSWQIVYNDTLNNYLQIVNKAVYNAKTGIGDKVEGKAYYYKSVSGFQYNGKVQSYLAVETNLKQTPVTVTYTMEENPVESDYKSDLPTFEDAGTYTVYFKAHASTGYVDVYGVIDVEVAPAELFAIPEAIDIMSTEYDPDYYIADSHSGANEVDIKFMGRAYGYQWFVLDESDSGITGDKSKVYASVPKYEIEANGVGGYYVSVLGTESVSGTGNYEEELQTFKDVFNNDVAVILNQRRGTVKMANYGWGETPDFTTYHYFKPTFVVRGDLEAAGTQVKTLGKVYNAKNDVTPNPVVTVETAKSGLRLSVSGSNYRVLNNSNEYINSGDYTFYVKSYHGPNEDNGYKLVYTTGSHSGQFTIHRAPVTVNWTPAADNTYAGRDSDDALPTASFSGIMAEDVNKSCVVPVMDYVTFVSGKTARDAGPAWAYASLSESGKENYILVTEEGTPELYASEWGYSDPTPNKPADISYSGHRMYRSPYQYFIAKRELAVVWTAQDGASVSGKAYDGKTDGTGIPTASFGGVDESSKRTGLASTSGKLETVGVSVFASNSGVKCSISDVVNVGDYKLYAKISNHDQYPGMNYYVKVKAPKNVQEFEVTQHNTQILSKSDLVYRNVDTDNIYIKLDAPYAAVNDLQIKCYDVTDGKYVLDGAYLTEGVNKHYTTREGSTLITISNKYFVTPYLKEDHEYRFEITYKDQGYENVSGINCNVLVDEYHRRRIIEDEEPTKKVTTKLVVNTAVDE